MATVQARHPEPFDSAHAFDVIESDDLTAVAFRSTTGDEPCIEMEAVNVNWNTNINEAIPKGRKMHVTPEELIMIQNELWAVQQARQEATVEVLAAAGIAPTPDILTATLNELEQAVKRHDLTVKEYVVLPKEKIDFFGAIANYVELTMEVAAFMDPADLISVYAISKDFHEVLNGHLTHCMTLCAETHAPRSAVAFHPRIHYNICIPDPVGRCDVGLATIRRVPGLRWLQMVIYRDGVIKQILACMARQGHRMPKGMSLSLKKMWSLMDIPLNDARRRFIAADFFKNDDLYNIQLFMVKLDMRFNDPIEGPGGDHLRVLMMGQKSLKYLRDLLKRKLAPLDVIKMLIRYNHTPEPQWANHPLWGIPPHEFGTIHREGWGAGVRHLLRPDELVIRESVRRGMGLKHHLMNMMLWGYVDMATAQNTPPTEAEMYMSDDGEIRSDYDRMVERRARVNRIAVELQAQQDAPAPNVVIR